MVALKMNLERLDSWVVLVHSDRLFDELSMAKNQFDSMVEQCRFESIEISTTIAYNILEIYLYTVF